MWLVTGALLGAGLVAGAAYGVASVVSAGEPVAEGPPRFLDESETSGVEHTYDGEFQYFVGGGIASFDCSGDGFPELYVAGGENTAGLYLNRSGVGSTLSFERLADAKTDLRGVTGAYPIDVDSDGNLDLAVLRVGENQMLRGLGDCRFEPANDLWGVDGGDEWTVAFSARWETGEAFPTMAFGNYLELGESDPTEPCDDHYLHQPVGDGYADRSTLSPGWCTLSILFSDWSNDGTRDLRMTNDRHYYRDGEEQLWRVGVDGAATEYGRDDGWEKMQIWGMGIASHDVTGDGLAEVFLTSQGDNKLQTLADGPDQPSYTDIALASGATAHRPFQGDVDQPSTAWHAEFDDVNNDGLIDLFVSKGNVDAMPEFAALDPNNLLLGQVDGTFVEGAPEAGLLDYDRSRGAVVTDLNLDGLLDLVVVERRVPVKVWRNTGTGTANHWLGVQLSQPGSNTSGTGAFIEVEDGRLATRREVTIGGGHASGDAGWIHFGLGAADEARVRVIWPDGEVGEWESVAADGFVVVHRDQGVETWAPLRD